MIQDYFRKVEQRLIFLLDGRAEAPCYRWHSSARAGHLLALICMPSAPCFRSVRSWQARTSDGAGWRRELGALKYAESTVPSADFRRRSCVEGMLVA